MIDSLEGKLSQYFPFLQLTESKKEKKVIKGKRIVSVTKLEIPKPSKKGREEIEAILKPFLRHFKGISKEDLAQVLWILKWHLISLKEAKEEGIRNKEMAEARKAYHQGIINLKHSLKYLFEEDLEGVIFKFKESKLNPKRKRQSFTIPVNGLPIEILKKLFHPFYSESLDSKGKEALRNIIPEYVEAYESFNNEFKVLAAKNAPLAKAWKKILESDKEGLKMNFYFVSFRLSEFFKNHLAYNSKADIPEFIPVFLKEYFLLIGIIDKPEITSNTFKGWIKKGKDLKY